MSDHLKRLPKGAKPQKPFSIHNSPPLDRIGKPGQGKSGYCGIEVTGRGRKLNLSLGESSRFELPAKPGVTLKEFFQKISLACESLQIPESERMEMLMGLWFLQLQLNLPVGNRDPFRSSKVWRHIQPRLASCKLLDSYRQEANLRKDLTHFLQTFKK